MGTAVPAPPLVPACACVCCRCARPPHAALLWAHSPQGAGLGARGCKAAPGWGGAAVPRLLVERGSRPRCVAAKGTARREITTRKSPSPRNKKRTRWWLPAARPGGARGINRAPKGTKAQSSRAPRDPQAWPGSSCRLGSSYPMGWSWENCCTEGSHLGANGARCPQRMGQKGSWVPKKAPGSPKRLGDVKAEKQAQRQRVGPKSICGERERPPKGQERDWIHEAAENRPGSLIQDVGPSSYPALSKLCSVKKKVNC